MGLEVLSDLFIEDQQLVIGSRVRVHWSDCGYSYAAQGIIIRLERQNAEVQLLSPLGHSKDRPSFQTLSIPRVTNSMEWSSSRCLRLEKN